MVLTFVPSCGSCAECSSGRPALCTPAAAANGSGTLLHGPSLLRDGDGKLVHHHLGVSGFARHAVVARESAVVVLVRGEGEETLSVLLRALAKRPEDR